MLLQVVGYQLWAQLGSNQRPPDYESDFFAFRCLSSIADILQVVEYLALMFSSVFHCSPLIAIVVYSILHPIKIILLKI